MTRNATSDLVIVGLEGCMSSAVAGTLDAFSIAANWDRALHPDGPPPFRTRVATPDGRPVRGYGGFGLPVDAALADTGAADYVVVPPVIDDIEAALSRERAVVAWIGDAAARGSTLASVCTGAFFLAEAGLLDGKRATTNSMYVRPFRRRYPNVRLFPESRLLDEGATITSGSTTAFIDLSLRLI